MRLPLVLAALVALFAPPIASAEWLSLRSDHFQVIGEVGEGDLRNVALKFEQFRDVISQLNPAMLGDGSAPLSSSLSSRTETPSRRSCR